MTEDNHDGHTENDTPPQPSTDVNSPNENSARTSTDLIYHLLSNERRRILLSSLLERPDERVPVDDVIDEIARHERPDPGPVSHRDRVTIDLHHVHLPKLADAGVIEHDPVTRTVRYEGPEALAILLAATDEIETQEE